MDSITIHLATSRKHPSAILAVPMHKEVPITDEVAKYEATLFLNWMGECLPGNVYDIIVKELKGE